MRFGKSLTGGLENEHRSHSALEHVIYSFRSRNSWCGFLGIKAEQAGHRFHNGGGGFSGFQNGLAIAGDYMSAASFLGIAGTIALFGYDGFLYSIGFLVAWLVALLLIAEPLRNSGRFTMGDVLAFRMKQRPVRTAAAASTVVVSVFYLLAQMVGAGALVALL